MPPKKTEPLLRRSRRKSTDVVEPVVVCEKIDKFIPNMSLEVIGEESAITPRRRSARLSSSARIDYSPVPAKRRRSTSSTSSIAADEVKVVVPRLCAKTVAKKMPEKIVEEECIEIESEPEKINDKFVEIKTSTNVAKHLPDAQTVPSDEVIIIDDVESKRVVDTSTAAENLEKRSIDKSRQPDTPQNEEEIIVLSDDDTSDGQSANGPNKLVAEEETAIEIDAENMGSTESAESIEVEDNDSNQVIAVTDSEDVNPVEDGPPSVEVKPQGWSQNSSLAEEIEPSDDSERDGSGVPELSCDKESSVDIKHIEYTMKMDDSTKLKCISSEESTDDVSVVKDESNKASSTLENDVIVVKDDTSKPLPSHDDDVSVLENDRSKLSSPPSNDVTESTDGSKISAQHEDRRSGSVHQQDDYVTVSNDDTTRSTESAEIPGADELQLNKENCNSLSKNLKSKDKLPKQEVAKKLKHAEVQALGRRESGRFWKSDRDRFRSVIKSRGLKQNYKQRMEQKEAMKRVKAMEQAMKEEKERERQELKARQEANKKKREENWKKTEIVQVIKNPAKIKRMKKKQLRMLEKRDITVVQK